ncbi:MAG: hypothetical protein AB1631_16005 [Acidobacteriota bacterium]
MTGRKKVIIHFVIAIALVSFAPREAQAGDRSFSSVVKHLESNYRARRQGTMGMITFARFLVKLIRPAGVKNFKVVLFREVNLSSGPTPGTAEFHFSMRRLVSEEWRPMVQYASRSRSQWVYVYVRDEKEDVKVLVVALQKETSFVAEVKFSPEKLAKFIDDPKIMGISLKEKNEQIDARQKSDPVEVKNNP